MPNKIVPRNQYLNRLIQEKDNELIKVLTGIRRSGKTYLLQMFEAYLKEEGVLQEQILYMNFESFVNEQFLEPKNIYKYVIEKAIVDKKMYLLFDEIQMVNDWQKIINSFRVDIEVDIYITGSNASLLSGELATLLAGRYTEIRVFPLSFREYLEFKSINKNDRIAVFDSYQEYFRM